jgi:hypothetical protein
MAWTPSGALELGTIGAVVEAAATARSQLEVAGV